MVVNKADKLVAWGRLLTPASPCVGCVNTAQAPPLIDAILPGLQQVAPDVDWPAAAAAVKRGEDVEVVLPGHVAHALELEAAMEADNVLPPPRSVYAPPVPDTVIPQPDPQWITGDSREQAQLLPDGELYDAIITCPPYADLEVYSDDPRDISTMDYPQFIEVFGEIMAASVARLRPGCFAAIVMGEVRDSSGFLRGLIPDTIRAMEAAGARFYNDGILLNSAGSIPLRAGGHFRSARKLSRLHQYVLVFVKGRAQARPARSDPARPQRSGVAGAPALASAYRAAPPATQEATMAGTIWTQRRAGSAISHTRPGTSEGEHVTVHDPSLSPDWLEMPDDPNIPANLRGTRIRVECSC